LCHSGKNKEYMIHTIQNSIESLLTSKQPIIHDVLHLLEMKLPTNIDNLYSTLSQIKDNYHFVSSYMNNVTNILDTAIYGQDEAKRNIERLIAQWINGEQTGKCLGFEGPPGCGKTSFAKNGIAKCLSNSDGTHRPFSFIALGGSSNASFLEGHSYTYVGSTWGKIVDILIEKQVMNPIIYIDELDKISKTEHGKELHGILTHLIDSTQNNEFYDKYFMGVPLNLSKVLFIFSYNDPSAIDKIVLDRIHRIQFNALNIYDKLIIANKHLLPELLKNVGMTNQIHFSDDVLTFIIQKYTRESGVRKLKDILFEIVGEINLLHLKNPTDISLPIHITIDDIKHNYLKNKVIIQEIYPPAKPTVGIVNGLWANSLKEGGVLQIESKLFCTDTFLELKLTGMQGDVMKESMNVAKTVVSSLLLTEEERKSTFASMKKNKLQGIHIHCPEGATPKDGPSAGMAITISLYSELTKKSIVPLIAMTGEINLRGEICQIGGIESKFLGGINLGIHTFIYPNSNQNEVDLFIDKYKTKHDFSKISFHPVKTIFDALKIIISPS